MKLTAGTRGVYYWRDFELDGSVAYSHRRNRGVLPPDNVGQVHRIDGNWKLQLGLTWHPGSAQRTLIGRAGGDEVAP